MNITKKCDLCDTALEFEDGGRRLVFKAHDEAFCRGSALFRIRTLERAMAQAAEDRGIAEMRLRAALHRNDIEARILRDTAARALRMPAGDVAELRDIEWTLEHLDEVVAKEVRARMDEARENSRIAVALACQEAAAR